MRGFLTILASTALVASLQPALAVTDKYNITPEERAACGDDAQRLCAATFPDEESLVSCMKANRSQLTPVCFATLKAGLSKRHMQL